jgi:hypothetical protein
MSAVLTGQLRPSYSKLDRDTPVTTFVNFRGQVESCHGCPGECGAAKMDRLGTGRNCRMWNHKISDKR